MTTMSLSRTFLINWVLKISFLIALSTESRAKSYSLSNHNMSAYQAWYYCDCINAKLGTMKSANETKKLISDIGNSSVGWIGLYRLPFIRKLVWMDGSVRGSYENGRIAVPWPSKGKHCVYVNSTDWIAANCFVQLPAICQGESTGLQENETCYNKSQEKGPSCRPVKTRTTLVPSTRVATPDTTYYATNFPSTIETGVSTSQSGFGELNGITSVKTQELTTVMGVSGSGQEVTTAQEVSSASATTAVSRVTTEAVTNNTVNLSLSPTEQSSQPTHTKAATEISTRTSTAKSYTSSTARTDTSATRAPGIEATTVTNESLTSYKSNPTTSEPQTAPTATLINHQQTSQPITRQETTSSITPLSTRYKETSATESALSITSKATSFNLVATTAALSNANVASASEAASFVSNFENRLLDMIISGTKIPNVQVTRLTSKDNKQYSEANPLAELPSTRINRLVPQGLGENDSFTAVIAQIRNERNLLQTLSNASEYPKSGYNDTVLVFNSTPILSLTALIENPRRKLNASASFDFNLTQDSTLETYAKSQSFVLGDFYKDTNVVRRLYYECRYVDTEKNLLSSDGCASRETGQFGFVRCECAHTTSFAVLLSISSFTVPSSVKVLSFITESISTVFLIITLIVLVKLRKSIRNDRTVVQINLTIALLLFHICNLFHDPAQQNERSCEMIAVLTHFFILASAAWMLLEGVILAHKTIGGVMDSRTTKQAKVIRMVMGWGVPALVVSIAAVAGFANNTYMQSHPVFAQTSLGDQNRLQTVPKYSMCWLNKQSGTLIGAVLAPVLLVLLVNTVIVCRMGCFVYKMSRQADNFKPTSQRQSNNSVRSKQSVVDVHHLLASIKAVAFLIPTLGLPWLLGVFAGVENYEASVAFMYLNSIVNGLQGVMIFVIYCIIGREVRKAIRSKWKRARAGSQQNFSEDKSHTSFKKEGTLQKIKGKKSTDSDRIFGVHQSTYGKFVELPRY